MSCPKSQCSSIATVMKTAPNWCGDVLLANQSFGKLSNEQLKGKWYILFFYPAGNI
jgi:peroxiredoxin